MTKTMNMIFEPMDLVAASPATVSRCGMIYIEPDGLGWQPMFDIWFENNIPAILNSDERDKIQELFSTFIDPLLTYHRHSLKESSPTQN